MAQLAASPILRHLLPVAPRPALQLAEYVRSRGYAPHDVVIIPHIKPTLDLFERRAAEQQALQEEEAKSICPGDVPCAMLFPLVAVGGALPVSCLACALIGGLNS